MSSIFHILKLMLIIITNKIFKISEFWFQYSIMSYFITLFSIIRLQKRLFSMLTSNLPIIKIKEMKTITEY